MVLLDIVVPRPLDSLELLAMVAPHHLVSLALEDHNQEVMVHPHHKVPVLSLFPLQPLHM